MLCVFLNDCLIILHLYPGQRLHDFTVGMTNMYPEVGGEEIQNMSVCATHAGEAPREVTLTCDPHMQPGQYIVVTIPGDYERLTLCEVVVEGGKYHQLYCVIM